MLLGFVWPSLKFGYRSGSQSSWRDFGNRYQPPIATLNAASPPITTVHTGPKIEATLPARMSSISLDDDVKIELISLTRLRHNSVRPVG